jgi:hypothetical protein
MRQKQTITYSPPDTGAAKPAPYHEKSTFYPMDFKLQQVQRTTLPLERRRVYSSSVLIMIT